MVLSSFRFLEYLTVWLNIFKSYYLFTFICFYSKTQIIDICCLITLYRLYNYLWHSMEVIPSNQITSPHFWNSGVGLVLSTLKINFVSLLKVYFTWINKRGSSVFGIFDGNGEVWLNGMWSRSQEIRMLYLLHYKQSLHKS